MGGSCVWPGMADMLVNKFDWRVSQVVLSMDGRRNLHFTYGSLASCLKYGVENGKRRDSRRGLFVHHKKRRLLTRDFWCVCSSGFARSILTIHNRSLCPCSLADDNSLQGCEPT